MTDTKKRQRSLADELIEYGRRSGDGFQRGAKEVGDLARMLMASAPAEVHDAATTITPYLPGYHSLASTRMGNDAFRQMREGNWGSGLETLGAAILKPTDDLFWFMPGGGVIPKVMK